MRKAKEVDLAGLRASIKKLQARNTGLELALEQKVS